MEVAFELITLLIPASQTRQFDQKALDDVKQGFEGIGVNIPWETVLSMAWLLAAVIVLLLVVYRWLRPSLYRVARTDGSIVKDPAEIMAIIRKSIDLRSVYDIEIQDRDYREIYKGQVLGINQEDQIEVELSSFIDPSLDFRNKEARVVFRMSRLGSQEFYQFDTYTLYVGLTDNYGRKEKAVRLALPLNLEVSQKRRYVRVKPQGKFAFKVSIVGAEAAPEPIPMNTLQRLHVAEISDISVGGLQVVIMARLSELKVKHRDEVFVHFRLPVQDLTLTNLDNEFIIKCRIISIQRQTVGRRVMSKEADERTVGPNLVRMEYVSRGEVDRARKTVSLRAASAVVFEDLSLWIHSYQRRQIQEARGTLPQPDRVKNLYPRQSLDVEEKYPRIQPKREDASDNDTSGGETPQE